MMPPDRLVKANDFKRLDLSRAVLCMSPPATPQCGEILSVAEMYAADRYAAEHGVPPPLLMENAGRAVADAITRFCQQPCPAVVLCGPGNNGGDGFVVARLLAERGWPVRLALAGEAGALKGDAALMAGQWKGAVESLSVSVLDGAGLVVDALYGAGLSRPLEGGAREVVEAVNRSSAKVVAIDVPSGLHGDLGRPLDDISIEADLTVTFFRMKPAHVLMPGRILCGAVEVADIGIPDVALGEIRPQLMLNTPALWGRAYPKPSPMGHKYGRGHAVVVSGSAHATGAARLAARGALRAGAGLVSVASPLDAVDVNAKHLTAIMVKPCDGVEDFARLLSDSRFNAVAAGPGLGTGPVTRDIVKVIVQSGASAVFDADALTAFRDAPEHFFRLLTGQHVLTPHEGEFERLFPGVLASFQNRVEAARLAARRAGCVVLLKGPDTVVAAPNGLVSINASAPPWLATAGSGDVLTGFITGLLAQHMPPFLAASAGVYLHGLCAAAFGPGLIAEDIPEQLPTVLRRLFEEI